LVARTRRNGAASKAIASGSPALPSFFKILRGHELEIRALGRAGGGSNRAAGAAGAKELQT
jgi:hypothetical protein